MPLRKEAPTPRSAAVALRSSRTPISASSGPLIPLKPGETSLRRQAILTEGEYTASLSRIIKRDFFPKLDRLKAENGYLTALEDGDAVQIRRALNHLLHIDELENGGPSNANGRLSKPRVGPTIAHEAPYMDTPAGRRHDEWEGTPLHSSPSSHTLVLPSPSEDIPNVDEEDISSGIIPELDMSVTQFQAHYTSEDNAAFEQLLQRDNQRRAHHYAWAYNAERRARQRRAELVHKEQKEAQAGKLLAIQTAEETGMHIGQKEVPLLIGAGTTDVAGTAQSERDVAADSIEEHLLIDGPRTDSRPANPGLGRWKYSARNALTFGPTAVELPPASSSSGSSMEPKPSITLRNTDFDEYDQRGDAQSEDPGSPTSTRIDAAVQRGARGTSSISSSSRDDRVDDIPKINGYGFVSPSLTPTHKDSQSQARSDSELLRIFNSSSHPPAASDSIEERQFRLPPESKRDQIATRLANRATQGASSPYGTQKYQTPALRSHAFPSSTTSRSPRASMSVSQSRQKDHLTPPARALLDRSTRNATPRTKLGNSLLSRKKPVSQQHDSISKRIREEALTMEALKRRHWTPSPSPINRREPSP